MTVRTVESKVDTMTVHICSGSDPNHGKGLGNYQAEKNDVSLSVVYFTSKMGLIVLNILKESNPVQLLFMNLSSLLSNGCHLYDQRCYSALSQNPPAFFGQVSFHIHFIDCKYNY